MCAKATVQLTSSSLLVASAPAATARMIWSILDKPTKTVRSPVIYDMAKLRNLTNLLCARSVTASLQAMLPLPRRIAIDLNKPCGHFRLPGQTRRSRQQANLCVTGGHTCASCRCTALPGCRAKYNHQTGCIRAVTRTRSETNGSRSSEHAAPHKEHWKGVHAHSNEFGCAAASNGPSLSNAPTRWGCRVAKCDTRWRCSSAQGEAARAPRVTGDNRARAPSSARCARSATRDIASIPCRLGAPHATCLCKT